MCIFGAVSCAGAYGRGKADGRSRRGAKNPLTGVPCWRTTCASMRVWGAVGCAAPTAGKADRFRPAEARVVAPPAGCFTRAACRSASRVHRVPERFSGQTGPQLVMAALDRGLSIRKAAQAAGVSVNTVRKVVALLQTVAPGHVRT